MYVWISNSVFEVSTRRGENLFSRMMEKALNYEFWSICSFAEVLRDFQLLFDDEIWKEYILEHDDDLLEMFSG